MAKKRVAFCVTGLSVLVLMLLLGGCDTEYPVLTYHTVYFDGNGQTGGTVPVFSITTLVNSPVTVPGNTGNLVLGDRVFLGWNTKADGTGYAFTPGEVFAMPAGNLTLYADWERMYLIGDIGPAGGMVFHDKGAKSDGWRYLEAAPVGWSGSAEDPLHVFGYYRTASDGSNLVVGTETAMGTGQANTEELVSVMGSNVYPGSTGTTPTTNYAARICEDYTLDEYADWFLPSKDELNLMYLNLKAELIGGFSDNYYWSSSESTASTAWGQDFGNGYQGSGYLRDGNFCIRPVRAF
ncbi:MAG: DUF1566 domain-containing protein [Sphaerochaetaceae bacterium]|jgi:uncharacterized repeat protein (TIGR02543 family)|nr:DUF1566 domain-containing protein [Sphaerochaetaceae bacterium]